MAFFDADGVKRAMEDKAGPRFNACIAEAPRALQLLLDDLAEQEEAAKAEQRELLDRAEEAEYKLSLVADHMDEAHKLLNRAIESPGYVAKATLRLILAQVNHARDKANEG